jgi:hypothetical protein
MVSPVLTPGLWALETRAAMPTLNDTLPGRTCARAILDLCRIWLRLKGVWYYAPRGRSIVAAVIATVEPVVTAVVKTVACLRFFKCNITKGWLR